MSDNRHNYERPPIGINSLPFWFAGGGSVEDSLPVVAELGFASVEIWTDHLWWTGEDPARLAPKLESYGLRSTVHCPAWEVNFTSPNRGIREESLRQVFESIEHAQALGADLLVVHPGRLGGPVLSQERFWELQLEAWDRLVAHADRCDVVLTAENMETSSKRHVVKTAEDIHRIVEHFPPGKLGVTFDTSHMGDTEGCLKFIAAGLDEITHVHLSDTETLPSGAVRYHLPLGEGQIDFQRVLDALLPGYRGVLSLETRIPNADRNLMLAQLRFLDKLLSS